MSDLKECKIIDTIDILRPRSIIQTPCGKFLIGIECHSVFRYNLETKQKFRIAGSVYQSGYQDGSRNDTRFEWPKDLTLSKDLKTLFVSDSYNCVIRAICVDTGVTTTFTGQVDRCEYVDGPKEKACFKLPSKLKLSPNGNILYVVDSYKLRTINVATGQVNTINTFEYGIDDFTLSLDGKHVYICFWDNILKFNLETCESEIVFKGSGFEGCDLSKDGQLLFISNNYQYIQVVNLEKNQVINTIYCSCIKLYDITLSTNNQNLYICDFNTNNVQVFDISKYCTNFKIFLKSQLTKHSFLSQAVVKRMSI